MFLIIRLKKSILKVIFQLFSIKLKIEEIEIDFMYLTLKAFNNCYIFIQIPIFKIHNADLITIELPVSLKILFLSNKVS